MNKNGHLICEYELTEEQGTFQIEGVGRDTAKIDIKDRLEAYENTFIHDPKEYGHQLFEMLFPKHSDLLTLYNHAVYLAESQDKYIYFYFNLSPVVAKEYHWVKWELLYDRRKRFYLGKFSLFGLSRYFPTRFNRQLDKPTRKLKMLVVISDPSNLDESKFAPIDKPAVKDWMEESFEKLGLIKGQFEISFLEGNATYENINRQLKTDYFDLLHFHGHGVVSRQEEKSGLFLEDDNGELFVLEESGEEVGFRDLFYGLNNLKLVTLMSCHSGKKTSSGSFGGMAHTLIEAGVPAVVAMHDRVNFATAKNFVAIFYENLITTGRPDLAINETRRLLSVNPKTKFEWYLPNLLLGDKNIRLCEAIKPKLSREKPFMLLRENDMIFSERHFRQWVDEYIGSQDNKKCDVLPIIGPGILNGILPSSYEIASNWAESEGFPYSESIGDDLPRVAEYVASLAGDPLIPHNRLVRYYKSYLLEKEWRLPKEKYKSLRDKNIGKVIKELANDHFYRDRDEPHNILAKLPIPVYLTTNYDSFMFEALKLNDKLPKSAYYIWKDSLKEQIKFDDTTYREEIIDYLELTKRLDGTKEKPLVFHLFGHIDSIDSLVLTERDHIDFLKDIHNFNDRVPNQLLRAFSQKAILFLGFDINGFDIRVFLQGILTNFRKNKQRVAIIQLEPENISSKQLKNLRDYIRKYCSELDIDIYLGSVREFLIELLNKLRNRFGNYE